MKNTRPSSKTKRPVGRPREEDNPLTTVSLRLSQEEIDYLTLKSRGAMGVSTFIRYILAIYIADEKKKDNESNSRTDPSTGKKA